MNNDPTQQPKLPKRDPLERMTQSPGGDLRRFIAKEGEDFTVKDPGPTLQEEFKRFRER